MYKRDDKRKKVFTRKKCFFCEKREIPSYREPGKLAEFLSERGRIHPRTRSGICSYHQRKVAQGIKRARHLALLPFVVRVK